MQDLSSSSRRSVKFRFPVLIILVLLVVCTHAIGIELPLPPAAIVVGLVVGYCLNLAFGDLVQVRLDGETLLISDDSQEIKVPLSNLKRASCSRLSRPEVVTLTFKKPTQFGETVRFIATYRFFRGFSDHPVVAMLNARAKAAAASEADSTAE